jgi:O-antigen/teichoic acid export membrane protein
MRVSYVKLRHSRSPDEAGPSEPHAFNDWFRPTSGSAQPRKSRSGQPDGMNDAVFVTTGEMPITSVTLELPAIPYYGEDDAEQRADGRSRDTRYHTAYALIINTVSTTGLGFVYWAVAAHVYSRQTLGRSSALLSALILLSTLTQLNISSALQRYLPKAGRSAARLIGYGYAVSSFAALPAAIGFVLLMPRISKDWQFLAGSPLLAWLFVAAALVWGIFALEDAALTGLRRAGVVPVENSAYGVLKLAMLICVAGILPASGIFASWVVPLVVIIPVVNVLIFRRYVRHQQGGHEPRFRRREILRFTSADYLASLCNQAYGSLLPLLVLSTLGAAANGSFYVAWTISAGPTMLAANFGTSLMVEAASAPDRLAELTRGIALRCAVTTLLCAAVLTIAAHPILRIYGKDYADQAAPLLIVLGVAAVPRALIMLTWSLDRVSGHMGRAAVTQAVLAILVVGGSRFLLGKYGIAGIGYAWLGANTCMAIIRLPTLSKAAGLGRRRIAPFVTAPLAPAPSGLGQSAGVRHRAAGKHRAPRR